MTRWLRQGHHKVAPLVRARPSVAVVGQVLATYRALGRPLLGRRTARAWLKRLGEGRIHA